MAETATLSLAHVVHAVISTINADELEDGVDKLHALFPESTIVAALDLVDRDCVLRYTTSWGRLFYEVLGSTSTYAVFPWLQGRAAPPSSYCSCPTFADAVLFTESQLMCKHLLAVCLAEQLSRCVDRPTNDDQVVARVAAHAM